MLNYSVLIISIV